MRKGNFGKKNQDNTAHRACESRWSFPAESCGVALVPPDHPMCMLSAISAAGVFRAFEVTAGNVFPNCLPAWGSADILSRFRFASVCGYRNTPAEGFKIVDGANDLQNIHGWFDIGKNALHGLGCHQAFIQGIGSDGGGIRQHRTIASADLSGPFAPFLQFQKREIHTVFPRF